VREWEGDEGKGKKGYYATTMGESPLPREKL